MACDCPKKKKRKPRCDTCRKRTCECATKRRRRRRSRRKTPGPRTTLTQSRSVPFYYPQGSFMQIGQPSDSFYSSLITSAADSVAAALKLSRGVKPGPQITTLHQTPVAQRSQPLKKEINSAIEIENKVKGEYAQKMKTELEAVREFQLTSQADILAKEAIKAARTSLQSKKYRDQKQAREAVKRAEDLNQATHNYHVDALDLAGQNRSNIAPVELMAPVENYQLVNEGIIPEYTPSEVASAAPTVPYAGITSRVTSDDVALGLMENKIAHMSAHTAPIQSKPSVVKKKRGAKKLVIVDKVDGGVRGGGEKFGDFQKQTLMQQMAIKRAPDTSNKSGTTISFAN